MLSDIFFSNRKYCFLTGAGISYNEPSNLPLAKDIIFNTLNALELEETISNEIENKILENTFRFEQFMELISRVFDPELTILNQLSNCNSPNVIHHFLADAINNYHHVFTTNFDNLIESACKQKNVSVKCLYDQNQLLKDNCNILCKLHGTIKDENGKDVRNSIVATLARVGQKGEAFSNDPFLKDYFIDKLSCNDLIVLGYSGSDDYDILPIIIQAKSNKRIFWIWHINESNKITIHNYESFSEKYGNQSKLFKQLLSNGNFKKTQLSIIEGNTTTIIMELHKIINKNIITPPVGVEYKIPSNFYLKWSLLRSIEDWRKNIFIGEYYHLLGSYKEASNYFQFALTELEKIKDYYRTFNILIKLSDTYIRSYKFEYALNCLEKFIFLLNEKVDNGFYVFAQKIININKKELNEYYRHLAICYNELGNIEKSFAILKKIKKENNTSEHAFTLYEFARIYYKKGNYAKAIFLAEKAINIHRKYGNLNSLSICLLFLSNIYNMNHNLKDSLSCISEVAKICEITNNSNIMVNLRNMTELINMKNI